MKSIKMALLGGAALAVTAAGAQADDLEALKAQINELNARMAAMEAAPSVPAGYQLLTVSEGELRDIPGLEMSPGERKRAGSKATVISVLPTADAPVGTTITWNGRVTAGLVYNNSDTDIELRFQRGEDARRSPWGDSVEEVGFGDGNATGFETVPGTSGGTQQEFFNLDVRTSNFEEVDGLISALKLTRDGDRRGSGQERRGASYSGGDDSDDIDVYANSRLRVTGVTDTAVGEVGVTMEMRADMDGRTDFDVYMNEAWGWWAMTPELTFGGGYTGSLADIGYGYDGACSCYYIDNAGADMAFNPGDTTQMRLSYGSGPFSMAVALEDATDYFGDDKVEYNSDRLGVAGQMKYSGDTFSGEISGGWWDVNEEEVFGDLDTQWQVGAGLGFSLGEMISFSVAAAMGEGPLENSSQGGASGDSLSLPINNQWWGVTALASIGMTDGIHAEIAGGYKKREGDDFRTVNLDSDTDEYTGWDMDGFEYDVWSVMGGLYYTPVDQLTIGIEGEYWTKSTSWDGAYVSDNDVEDDQDVKLSIDNDTFVAAFVGVWRF